MDGSIGNEKKEILTPREISKLLSIPLSTVYKLTAQGKFKATKVGKHLLPSDSFSAPLFLSSILST
ncbi:MAG: helix-turn-helix domain-containing protein [Candidatus Omnitrophica bacterium]|nr:helix-turn-helix domain-containing protein [Candidatus Omnitrophota bacterium]